MTRFHNLYLLNSWIQMFQVLSEKSFYAISFEKSRKVVEYFCQMSEDQSRIVIPR